jgi:adenosylmethionine-8-amino-7-oxononanoate aminotransferase
MQSRDLEDRMARKGIGMRDGLVQSFFAPATRPRIIRAEGIWFIDSEGRRYIDASSGPVACNLGHGNPRVLDAMTRQARDLAFAFPTQFETEANEKLGHHLAELYGPGRHCHVGGV